MKNVEFTSIYNLKKSFQYETKQKIHSIKPLLLNVTSMTPLKIAFLLILITFILSFQHRAYFILFLSLLSYLTYTFLFLRSLAYSLVIQRLPLPKIIVQHKKLKMKFIIKNYSSFTLKGYMIEDKNHLQKKTFLRHYFDNIIPPKSQQSLSYVYKSDSQIGEQSIGPFSLIIKDPLDIFEYRIHETDISLSKIYPDSKEQESLHSIGSLHNLNYGLYNTIEKGSNVNFNGVREYRRGDSLKHVSWKLSAKHNKFLIKEFEKSVNSINTIYLDLNPYHHIESDELSSWISTIEIALDLATQLLENQNSVQIITPHLHIPLAKGELQLQNIINQLLNYNLYQNLNLELENGENHKDQNNNLIYQLKKNSDHISQGSTLFVVSPCFESKIQPYKDIFLELKNRNIVINVLIVQLSTYVSDILDNTPWAPTVENITDQLVYDKISNFNAFLVSTTNYCCQENVDHPFIKLKELQEKNFIEEYR